MEPTAPLPSNAEDQVERPKATLWVAENFYSPDSPSNIVMDGEHIKSCTLPKLIARLTSEQVSPDLLNDFLLTYRSFEMDGLDLLDALKARVATATAEDLRNIRIRVANVIRHWIGAFWYDFTKDCPALSNCLYEWLQVEMTKGAEAVYSNLKTKLDNALDPNREKKKQQQAQQQVTEIPRSYPPRDASVPLLECNSEEIARQLTLIEWKLWSAIRPYEFLNLAWTKKDKDTRAGNVLAMIERFNYVSGWVATTIIFCENPKQRVKITQKFVDIAHKLYLMNNFNGLMAILSGLNRGPVYRLRQTFAAVEAKDSKKIFSEVQLATASDKSYACLRRAIRNANPPCLPYLGMYLTDMTFIEEGNKNYTTDSYKLINFHKRRLISSTIADVKTYQGVKYQFLEVPEIQSKAFGEATFEDKELYEISDYLEPRAGKERGEKPILLVQGLPPRKEEERGRMDLDLSNNPGWSVFTTPDGSSNTLANASGQIVGLTFFKVMEKITHPVTPDAIGLLPLLATMDTWTSPHEFLDALVLRFNVPLPKDKSDESMHKFTHELQSPIWLRVLNVVKSWITHHFYHFYEDSTLKEKMLLFIGTVSNLLPTPAASLTNLLSKQLNNYLEAPKSAESSVPEPIIPETVKENPLITDFEPIEVARQLCLRHFEIFHKIRPSELLASKDENRPNVKAMDDNLVILQSWVLDEIAIFQKMGQTSTALNAFGMIAFYCSTLNNWHAALAIVNAFNSVFTTVKVDWGKVNQAQGRKFYFDHRDIFMKKKELGDLLKGLQLPCVPLLAPFRGAIDLIMKTNPKDMLNSQIINVEKKKKLGDVICKVQKFQKINYNFITVPAIQSYISKPREVSHLVCGLGANLKDFQTTSSSMMENLLRDPEFQEEIKLLTQEVYEEEMRLLAAEAYQLAAFRAVDPGTGHPSAAIVTDPNVRAMLLRAFPGCSYITWSLTSQSPAMTVIKSPDEKVHHLLEIKEKVALNDVAALVRTGHIYKATHQDVLLSSVLVVNSIGDQAIKVAERCRIRIMKM